MKKKLFIAFILITIGVLIWSIRASNSSAQQAAIERAKEYRPNGICTQAITPAVHTATGAKYTFSSGCLAPGWEPGE